MTVAPTKVGHIGWRRASWGEILAEVDNPTLFPSGTIYMLLERPEDIKFTTRERAVEEKLLEQQWQAGHFFSAIAELQFQRTASDFVVWLLIENPLPAGWQQSEEFEAGGEVSLLLWGERKRVGEPGWRETRIPRWLDYPVEKGATRVHLVAIPYLREGMVVRFRLKGVKKDEAIADRA
jgi:hypothetical protein